jgi:SAM-dependent methyltransferase
MRSAQREPVSKAEKTSDVLVDYFDTLWGSEDASRITHLIERVKLPLHQKVHDFVSSRRDSIKSLLEIGPGHGWDAQRFRGSVSNYLGVELSPVSCRTLRSRYGLPVVRAQAEELPVSSESLDCVYLSTTLMHLRKRETVEEIMRCLKSGGYFVFIEPQGSHPLVQIYQKIKYRNLPHTYLNGDDLTFIRSKFQTVEESHWGLLFIGDTHLNVLNRLLRKVDQWLFQFPLLCRFSWLYLGIFQKPE